MDGDCVPLLEYSSPMSIIPVFTGNSGLRSDAGSGCDCARAISVLISGVRKVEVSGGGTESDLLVLPFLDENMFLNTEDGGVGGGGGGGGGGGDRGGCRSAGGGGERSRTVSILSRLLCLRFFFLFL